MNLFPRTFTLFTFEGISLKITVPFQIFICLIGLMVFIASLSGGLVGAIGISWFVICAVLWIYGFVTIHEFGHSLAAKRLGYKVRDISLYPMAGLAAIHGDYHKKPWDELVITFWGPFTNVIMGLCFYLLSQTFPDVLFLQFCVHINMALVIFNLIPAYPMDGGRILRACIGLFCKDWWTATLWATRVSFVCGLIAIPIGFYLEYAVAGLMIAFMGIFMSQMDKEGLKINKEIEDLDHLREMLLRDLIKSWVVKVWPNDTAKQEEFTQIVLSQYQDFFANFTIWSGERKFTEDMFAISIACLFSILNDENNRKQFDDIIKTDEKKAFEELERISKLKLKEEK